MKYIKLGDICSIKTGKLNANSSVLNGRYPFFSCSKEPSAIDSYSYNCECVLVAGNGDLNVKYYNGKFDAYQRTYIIEINDKKVFDTKFIYLLIKSKINELRKQSIGGVIKYIKLNNLTNINVPVITILEQKNIVDKLFKINEIINIKSSQISRFNELIKSQFVKMFGDPFALDNNKKIELKNLIISSNNGLSRRGNDKDGSIVIRLVELQRNYIDYSNFNRIKLKENEKRKYKLFDGDVLFARVNGNSNNVGRCAVFKEFAEDVYHNDHTIRVKFDITKVNPIYLCELLNDEYGKNEFKNKIKTSAGQYTISQDGIENVKIFLPNIELQNKFASIVEQINKQKSKFEESLKKLKELQSSLMQEYFE